MEPYILLIGKIGDSGKEMMSNIKFDIENNEKLIDVYGELKPKGREGLWSAHDIELANGVFVRSIGMRGRVRSGQKRGWRYTLIIGDDVQDSMDMREPTTLEADRTFWEREVEPAIDQTYGKIRYIGNLLGKGCLLDYIMKDTKYRGTSFHSLENAEGKPDHIHGTSTWPKEKPTAKLRQAAQAALSKGRLAIWLAEHQNVITDELTKSLKGYRYHHMSFRRHHDVQNVLDGPDYPYPIPVNTYLTIDPAFAETKTADERAIIVFAKGRMFVRPSNVGEPSLMNCIWILEYVYNHMAPHKIIQLALELHKKYFFNGVIIETIGGQKIYEPMMYEISMGDSFFSQHPFSPSFVNYHRANKKDRIYAGLQPRMSIGQVFIRPEMVEFINECEMFDTMESPHLLDALEFGNSNSVDCIAELYQPELRHERRRRDLAENENRDYRNWAPTNIGQLKVR